jgi:hypothetical protein
MEKIRVERLFGLVMGGIFFALGLALLARLLTNELTGQPRMEHYAWNKVADTHRETTVLHEGVLGVSAATSSVLSELSISSTLSVLMSTSTTE